MKGSPQESNRGQVQHLRRLGTRALQQLSHVGDFTSLLPFADLRNINTIDLCALGSLWL